MLTQGPNYPAYISNGAGSNPWTGPENVAVEDGAYAISPIGVLSNQLIALEFGFSIPDGSIIAGILVEIKRGATLNTVGEHIEDYELYMEEGGSFTFNFAAAGNWDTSVGWHSYGGPTNLLGIDDFFGDSYATAQDINQENWGCSIRVNGTGIVAQARIDAIRITVYYFTKSIAADSGMIGTATGDLTITATAPTDWHISADCVATATVTCRVTGVVIPACIHEWDSCTTYEIPWNSDC